ncbi:hypothetical protein ABTM69_19990, partial [Acinetobacter baumannii]
KSNLLKNAAGLPDKRLNYDRHRTRNLKTEKTIEFEPKPGHLTLSGGARPVLKTPWFQHVFEHACKSPRMTFSSFRVTT